MGGAQPPVHKEPDPVPFDVTYKTEADVPTDYRKHAVKKDDGSYVLSVTANGRVTEFRDNNIALKKEKDTWGAERTGFVSLIGEKPEEFKTELERLKALDQQVKDGEITGTAKIETTVQERMTAAKAGYEGQLRDAGQKLTASETAKAVLRQKYERLSLHTQLTAVILAAESGARPEALPDILAAAETQWKVQEDGSIVRMDGDTKIYGDNGDPMSPKEWLEKFLKSKNYFAKVSAGGGATGAANAVGLTGISQEALDKMSPTARIRMARSQQRR